MSADDDPRALSRARWEKAAAGWEAENKRHQRDSQVVSVWLIEHVEPQPGYKLLELAAGVGDTGLLAAELVQPGGTVVITDGADAMVAAAQRRAEEQGVRNVEIRQMEAEWIDLPTASVDGVLCRWGYMLLHDPDAALRETRRVLRPGGRVALAAWAAPERNPWMSAVGRSITELGLAEPADPEAPGPFRFAAEGRIQGLLEDAGFDEVLVEPLDFVHRHASLDAYFEHTATMSINLRETLDRLSPADHTRLRDAIDDKLRQYVRADGSVELPARTWVASALA